MRTKPPMYADDAEPLGTGIVPSIFQLMSTP